MAQEKTTSQDMYEDLEAMNSLNEAHEVSQQEEMARLQAIAEMQEEWFSRTPEENVALLNADGSQTGVYGFSYIDASSPAENIPGMNVVEYAIPGDPNGGKYVGYESYEQTFQRATEEYQSSFVDGQTTDEAEAKYQAASEAYENSREDYDGYLYDNPTCPDYLRSADPVSTYVGYEIPRREAEALSEQESREAADDISIDEASAYLDGQHGTFSVHTNAYYSAMTDGDGLTEADAEAYSPDEYVVRQSTTISSSAIRGMQNYLNSSDVDVPEITAEKGTDEYGRQVVAQMEAIDEDLARRDSSYKSQFPSGMRYLAEGENPPAIPGMTVVIGKIDGAPGYYAGYETYDETYSKAITAADAEAQAIEEAYDDPNADLTALSDRTEANNALYESANANYDYQKNQYEEYISEHPGNDFMMKSNPVNSYGNYTSTFAGGAFHDFVANAKEYLSDGFSKGYDNIQAFGKRVQALLEGKMSFEQFFKGEAIPNQYTEAQAAAVSAEYWAKRAELEPDNEVFQQRATEAKDLADSYKTEEQLAEEAAAESAEQNGLKSIGDSSEDQAENAEATTDDTQASIDAEADVVSGAAPSTDEGAEVGAQTDISSEEVVAEDDDVITADSAYETGVNPLEQNGAGGYPVNVSMKDLGAPYSNEAIQRMQMASTGNTFRDIVNQGTKIDNYTYQYAPSWNSYLNTVENQGLGGYRMPMMPQGSTGFDMLDEMNQGGTSYVDRLMHQLPSDNINAQPAADSRTPRSSRPLPVVEQTEPVQETKKKDRPLPAVAEITSPSSPSKGQKSGGNRGDIQARLAALEGKLERNGNLDGPQMERF